MPADGARPNGGRANGVRRGLRVAIDAGDLARDRRGIGRLARAAIAAFALDARLSLTLLAAARDEPALRGEFAGLRVARTSTANEPDRYDVVWYPFNGVRFACRAPAVVTMHDAFAFTHPHRDLVARYRERAPIRRAARVAARIVTTCSWTRDEIARVLRLDPCEIAIVVPQVDPFFFPAGGASPGEAVALPEALRAGEFALVVGAREARKNVRLAIDACAAAQRDAPGVLAIVGELSERDRAYARSRAVRLHEIDAGDDLLRALYRRARVVLVPSLDEGFGLVAPEAMACGAVVLASNAGALPESTRGAATLLDPRDPAAWAAAIARVVREPAFADERRAAALAAFANDDRSRFGREMAGLLVDVGDTAASGRPGRGCSDEYRRTRSN